MKTTPTKLAGFKRPATQCTQSAVKYFDLTPTWEGIMPALIAAAANDSPAAIEELMRLARIVDRQNKLSSPQRRAGYVKRFTSAPALGVLK